MASSDYYSILGISPQSTPEEIKRAFRAKAMEFHPDRNPENAEAAQLFKEASLAYSILSDPPKRARYDQFGAAGVNGNNTGFAEGMDLNDIFGEFMRQAGFGDFAPRQSASSRPSRGEDLEMEYLVSFIDSLQGAVHEFSIQTYVGCIECASRGSMSEARITCSVCGGSGHRRSSFLGIIQILNPCQSCDGAGSRPTEPCSACRAQGRVMGQHTFRITIPAGVISGSVLRVNGEGAVGKWGAPSGDAYFHLQVAAHPDFVRAKNDLVSILSINMVQAALGDEIMTKDPLGNLLVLKIPASSQNGQEIRLRRLGYPTTNSSRRGDLVFHLVVLIPKSLSAEQKDLLRRFGQTLKESNQGSFLDKLKQKFV